MIEDDYDENRQEDEVAREDTYCETAKDVLGYRARKNKSGISPESWKGVEGRKQFKQKVARARLERLKARLQQEYRKKDLEVKKRSRNDKRERANNIAQEAEDAAKCGQMKDLHDTTRRLRSESPKKIDMVRNNEDNLLTREEEVQQRWKEHFVELLNRPNPEHETEVSSGMEVIEEIPSGPITKAEIRSAITSMKAGKAPCVDYLTVELLKADITTTVDVLHDLFCEIWVSKTVPADWRRGLIVKIAKKGDLNWRGISLMSVAAKVMGKVLIRRISGDVDAKLRKEQAGFRKGRGAIEQIFVLKNIVEQAVEWNSSRVPNEEIRARAGSETISKQVARRRWTWLGHVLRMDYHSHPRIALTWVPEGKR